jgi:citrate synthase
MAKKAKFVIDNQEYECPVYVGTEGEVGVDIINLRAKTGVITMDNGYGNTCTGVSKITFLDGENGILRYRGIPIEQLAEHSNFLEVSYLLIYGHLPTPEEFHVWENSIKRHTLVKEDLVRLFDAFPREAHPMGVLSAAVSGMSTFYQEHLDPKKPRDVNELIIKLMGKLPTLAAYAYKTSINQPRVYPQNHLDYCGNFLNMMFSVPSEKYELHPEIVEALNLLFILHADHEQNCSTSTVRLIGSAEANLFASISGGISALWGPLHGGANQAVMEMLQEIHDDGGNVKKFVELAKDKNSSFRLMGFGHRVYKNFDPRAKIIKKACDKVLSKMGINSPLLAIAKELEEAALKDQYFVDRKLYPNVDFYSGIIYSALNIPVNMFTAMFALGRLPGWIAHWKEMNETPGNRIGRPRQIYDGNKLTNYLPMAQRKTFKKSA